MTFSIRSTGFSLSLTLFLAVTPTYAQDAADAIQPEAQIGLPELESGETVKGTDWIVTTANPHASRAGAEVLRNGGNAIDAMVAIQTTLGLVEPQSSGLGGGGFLVYWDNEAKKLKTYDARETAPLGVTPNLFLDEEGRPLEFFTAALSGLSIGVPGIPKLLEKAHGKYGKRPWAELLEQAKSLAEDGFEISPRMAGLVARRAEFMRGFDATARYFLNADGTAKPSGTLLKNPDYAETLRLFAEQGADVFYTGAIAEKIVETVRRAPTIGGTLSMDDLALYEVKERTPVCAPYRGYNVCGSGPPSSGGVALGQILGILENFDLRALGPDTHLSWQLIGDATRLAFADRRRYLADIDFVPVPVNGLLKKDYLESRAALLEPGRQLGTATAGFPSYDHAFNFGDGTSLERPSTTHFVVRDSDGNIVSMTSSIESAFGSHMMTGGFLLNNQLTDFSFQTNQDGRPIANAAAPGKRPRSSMTPTIVLRDGEPVYALGSPGGSRIIGYVAKSVVALIDWDMNIQEAFDLAHIVNRFGIFALEENTKAVEFQAALEGIGYRTVVIPLNSGLHGIAISGDTLEGGADGRREGVVIAE